MRPDVCRFVSEIVYDNRLDGLPELATQATAFGTGLRFLPVEHVGNVAAAPEEAELIAHEIQRMRGGSWTNRKGETRPLAECDFMVVAPYNAGEQGGLASRLPRAPTTSQSPLWGSRRARTGSRPLLG